MYLDSSVKLYSLWLLLTLVLAMPNLSQSATVEVIPFMDSISLDDRSGLPLFDIPLDDSIDPGSYRLIVLLTAAGKDVLDDSYWLAFKETNFTFTK